jgi:hypothetical protein
MIGSILEGLWEDKLFIYFNSMWLIAIILFYFKPWRWWIK